MGANCIGIAVSPQLPASLKEMLAFMRFLSVAGGDEHTVKCVVSDCPRSVSLLLMVELRACYVSKFLMQHCLFLSPWRPKRNWSDTLVRSTLEKNYAPIPGVSNGQSNQNRLKTEDSTNLQSQSLKTGDSTNLQRESPGRNSDAVGLDTKAQQEDGETDQCNNKIRKKRIARMMAQRMRICNPNNRMSLVLSPCADMSPIHFATMVRNILYQWDRTISGIQRKTMAIGHLSNWHLPNQSVLHSNLLSLLASRLRNCCHRSQCVDHWHLRSQCVDQRECCRHSQTKADRNLWLRKWRRQQRRRQQWQKQQWTKAKMAPKRMPSPPTCPPPKKQRPIQPPSNKHVPAEKPITIMPPPPLAHVDEMHQDEVCLVLNLCPPPPAVIPRWSCSLRRAPLGSLTRCGSD